MAKKKNNLKDMSPEELNKKLRDLSEDLRAMKFKAEGAKSKNVKEAGALKKEIARALTELNKNNKKN